MRDAQITVVGSYATGLTMKVDRLPSCGETLLGTGYRVDHGGKGSNQAVGCARLRASVRFVAKIGKDQFGAGALDLYRNEGVDASFVTETTDMPTGVGFITVEASSGSNCIVLDPGANDCMDAEDVERAQAAFQGSAVVLTQLEIPVEAAGEAMRRGRKEGVITILNPAPVRPLTTAILQNVDILTPNESEAKVLAGYDPKAEVAAEQVARELLSMGVKSVVMTLGERGALLISYDLVKAVPAVRVSAVDTTGAGDAFNAGLATAVACGVDLQEAVQFAVVTGALAVTREGVIPALPHCEDVISLYAQQGRTPPDWFRSRRNQLERAERA
jgi:ribokinase